MSRQTSPFAALTGAQKQIRWLEYQSIRLPYVQADLENENPANRMEQRTENNGVTASAQSAAACERPQPPPEVPRTMPDFQKSRHSQYDAVIARMKQAELQSRKYAQQSKLPQQGH